MLWTALHFPHLPLERLAQAAEATAPRAIVDRRGTRRCLVACDAAARAAGLAPGMTLRGALGIVPGLEAHEYDAVAQAAHLEQLTLWACRYSALVSGHPPDTVLLEVRGSLRLFGGLDALLALLRVDAAGQGVQVVLGTAPTPAAAVLLARAGREEPVRSMERLSAALDAVPLERFALDPDTAAALTRSGLRTLGAVRALPPAALARRFGAELTDRLYRLDGRLPDPQTPFRPPATFAEASDLPLEAPDTASCAFVLHRLLGVLEGFLRGHDLGVRRLALDLYHHRHSPTVVTIAFLDATSDTAHLRRVATERLDGTTLPAPIVRLRVRASELGEVDREATPLIDGNMPVSSGDLERVIDTLIARFGHERVYTAAIVDDHRPEHAAGREPAANRGTTTRGTTTRRAARSAASPDRTGRAAGSGATPDTWPARPLWLLDKPRPVTCSLDIQPVSERIENGWWETDSVRRDYFIGRDEDGAHYWIYRERRDPAGRLWVQGLFA